MLGSNNTITTKRRTVSPTGKEALGGVILSDLPVYLEQLSPDQAVAMDGSFTFKMYRVHADGVIDIDEGDQVTDQDGNIYKVQGIEFFPSNEIPSHTEVILYKKDDKKNES